jgi:hypothetical protein
MLNADLNVRSESGFVKINPKCDGRLTIIKEEELKEPEPVKVQVQVAPANLQTVELFTT